MASLVIFYDQYHDTEGIRCLKTSFERLENYCDIVEAKTALPGYLTK